MSEWQSDADSDVEETESDTYKESYYILIAIDCAKSMFDNNHFEIAIKACFKCVESIIFKKTLYKKIAIVFNHEDPTAQILMDFKSSKFSEVVPILKNLSSSTIEDLKDLYCTDKAPEFSHFLVECHRMFRKLGDHVGKVFHYITVNSDPCNGDEKIKFQSLHELEAMHDSDIRIEILPLVENFNFDLFYKELSFYKAETKRYYFDLPHLSWKLRNALTFLPSKKNIVVHINESDIISCIERKYGKTAKLLPNAKCTKDLQNEVIRTKNLNEDNILEDTTCSYQLKLKTLLQDIVLTEGQKKLLYNCDVKIGLTMIHASNERYVLPGLIHKKPALLMPNPDSRKMFLSHWRSSARKKLYILCSLKRKEDAKIDMAELIPLMVDGEPCFLMTVMPQMKNIHHTQEPKIDIPVNLELDRVFDQFVKSATIENYDMTKMLPFKYVKQVEYFTKELFGPKYETEPYRNLVKEPLYDKVSGILALEHLINALPDIQVKPAKKGVKRPHK